MTHPFEGLPLDPARVAAKPLPLSASEARERGYSELDVVFITGDAYVDHPSFAMALLGRLLESAGLRVAILSQPNWRTADDFRRFGRPKLCFAVSAGNMDSMINHYTANRKRRGADAYTAGGLIGKRPDRATLAYCQRAREAYPGVPIVAGGVEASLRRLSHYDYWSDTVRRSILLDSKADLLGFGMGERTLLKIACGLHAGVSVGELRALPGVAFRLGESETRPTDAIHLPSHEAVVQDPLAFCELTRVTHRETNPFNAKRLLQPHGREAVVVNPPALPLTEAEMDYVYDLPFTRAPHPAYGQNKIPAFDVIRHSVQIMRGCFGGCSFCSITAHEGRIIQSRSEKSILNEIRLLKRDRSFHGTVSDLGGPTANMYRMRCTRPEVEATCRRLSCVHPTICKLLGTDQKPLLQLMKRARNEPGIKKVLVASGIRMDLAERDPEYVKELAHHHVGGHLKVAPEHTAPHVLELMKKPKKDHFEAFDAAFRKASTEARKEQYLIPYFIGSHPGSTTRDMIELALFLKARGYRPDQVQDFIPSPFDIASCMYHTGLDPMTQKPVFVAKSLKDRKAQRALLQFFKPENYYTVKEALQRAGRQDLIGRGPRCLISDIPPKEARELLRNRKTASKAQAARPNQETQARSVSPGTTSNVGYRPHRGQRSS